MKPFLFRKKRKLIWAIIATDNAKTVVIRKKRKKTANDSTSLTRTKQMRITIFFPLKYFLGEKRGDNRGIDLLIYYTTIKILHISFLF